MRGMRLYVQRDSQQHGHVLVLLCHVEPLGCQHGEGSWV